MYLSQGTSKRCAKLKPVMTLAQPTWTLRVWISFYIYIQTEPNDKLKVGS